MIVRVTAVVSMLLVGGLAASAAAQDAALTGDSGTASAARLMAIWTANAAGLSQDGKLVLKRHFAESGPSSKAAEVGALTTALAQALAEESIDDAKVAAAAERLNAKKAELAREETTGLVELYRKLSPSDRAKLASFRAGKNASATK